MNDNSRYVKPIGDAYAVVGTDGILRLNPEPEGDKMTTTATHSVTEFSTERERYEYLAHAYNVRLTPDRISAAAAIFREATKGMKLPDRPMYDGDTRLYAASRLRELASTAMTETDQALLVHAAFLLDGGRVEA